jgi:hypothetical protein
MKKKTEAISQQAKTNEISGAFSSTKILYFSVLWIGIKECKNELKNRKKLINFILSAGCSLLRAECFSCNLDVLKVGLGITDKQTAILD